MTVAFSVDAKLLAARSGGSTVEIRDARHGRRQADARHCAAVRTMTFDTTWLYLLTKKEGK